MWEADGKETLRNCMYAEGGFQRNLYVSAAGYHKRDREIALHKCGPCRGGNQREEQTKQAATGLIRNFTKFHNALILDVVYGPKRLIRLKTQKVCVRIFSSWHY